MFFLAIEYFKLSRDKACTRYKVKITEDPARKLREFKIRMSSAGGN